MGLADRLSAASTVDTVIAPEGNRINTAWPLLSRRTHETARSGLVRPYKLTHLPVSVQATAVGREYYG